MQAAALSGRTLQCACCHTEVLLCVKLAAQHGFKISNPELQHGIQLQKDVREQEQQQRQAEVQAQEAARQPPVHDAPPVKRERSSGGFEIG